jgi:DNA-binding NtrC family response regulator
MRPHERRAGAHFAPAPKKMDARPPGERWHENRMPGAGGHVARPRSGTEGGAMESKSPQNLRVLVVDDEQDFATALAERLRRRGLAADAVFSGHEALGRLAIAPYDVMVLDLKMPGLDGLSTLRQARQAHPDIQVVVLTGHGTVASGIEGMQVGAADFLQKPADIDDLCTAIRAAAESGRAKARTASEGVES